MQLMKLNSVWSETISPVPLSLNVSQLSIGDIAVVARLNWLKTGTLDGIPATIVDECPLLSALVDRVMAEPKIVAYLEARTQ